MSNQNYDFLILGQGLAGSLLGWNLEQQKQSYLIIDLPNRNSASGVSAGIVNPLIGRSFNLPWNFSVLNAEARSLYQELSSKFASNFLHDKKILRVLNSPKQQEQINQKLQIKEYQEYIGEQIGCYQSLNFKHQAFWTNKSYWIDITGLVESLRNFFIAQKRLLELNFDYQQLEISIDKISYQNLNFKKVIFAEGYRAINNPFADFLEFRPAKGEILDLKIPDLNLDFILNFGHFLLPLGSDCYRLGATYGWSDWEEELLLNQEHPLLVALEELTKLPYEIIRQKLGVRPIVAGQKPVIGQHPSYPDLYFLNGLGSKGALLAPYSAKQLINHLLSQEVINPEISTARFYQNI